MAETFDIKDVEIFAEGTWNGDKYSLEDLDKIVNAFGETKEHLKPYLKLGHSEKQKLLAEDELPAAGWVENLRRIGSKLLADFVGIPKKIYEIIKNGGYKRVSIELFINAKIKDKEFPFALKSIALLGGATPAVHNLDDVMALYGSILKPISFGLEEKIDCKSYESDIQIVLQNDYIIEKRGEKWCLISKSNSSVLGCHPTRDGAIKQEQAIKARQNMSDESTQKGEIKPMSDEKEFAHDEEMPEDMDGMKKIVKRLRQENMELKKKLDTYTKKNEELSVAVEEFKTKARHTEIKSTLSKLIQEKKISPSQEDLLFAILATPHGTETKEFSVGDKKYKNMEEVVLAFVDANKSNGLSTESKTKMGKKFSSDHEEYDSDGNAIVGIEEDKKIKEYAQEHKVSYNDAAFALSASGEIKSL